MNRSRLLLVSTALIAAGCNGIVGNDAVSLWTHDASAEDAPIASGDGGDGAPGPDGALPDGTASDARGATLSDGGVPVPAGWSLVGLDLATTSTCPTGFVQSAVVADLADAGCSHGACTPGSPVSCTGILTAMDGTSCLDSPMALSTAEACQENVGVGTSLGGFLGITSVATSTSCVVSASPGPVPSNAVLCSDPSPAICNDGVCYPSFPSSFEVCIAPADTSVSTCPATFPTAHQHLLGGTVSCSATCTYSAICTGTVDLYEGTVCNGPMTTFTVGGGCQSVPGIFQSYRTTAPPTLSENQCKVTKMTPTVTGQTLVCCQ